MKSYITQLRGLANGSQTLMQNMVAKIAQEVDIQPLSLYYFHAERVILSHHIGVNVITHTF